MAEGTYIKQDGVWLVTLHCTPPDSKAAEQLTLPSGMSYELISAGTGPVDVVVGVVTNNFARAAMIASIPFHRDGWSTLTKSVEFVTPHVYIDNGDAPEVGD